MRTDDPPTPDERSEEIGAEVPEADAIEQRRPAVPEPDDEETTAIPPDAPEADALEQATPVPAPDDDTDR